MEVVRYLNAVVPWPYPPNAALLYYRDNGPSASGTTQQLIGAIGLFRGETNNRGFRLAPRWQGQG